VRTVVHVVPHTHWDREWYHPEARFRLRLARLLDGLIPLLKAHPEIPSFLLDGQAITLDDYLAVRPELAGALRRLLADGRLEAGPWYVLADEFLVSGEALVRNLLEGQRAVRRHGGRPLAVGYSPDAFGHTGALPTILAGFGIEVALLWRGFGGEPGQEGDLYRWRASDGAEVLMVHLPVPGYENGANLPLDRAALAERWSQLSWQLAMRARTPHWLVLNGADHHAPQRGLPEIADALAEVADGVTVRLSSLEGYADAVRAWVREAGAELPLVTGELREGRRHAWSLQGTHGSRLYLKRANAECQRLLERYAEPLVALAGRAGGDRRAELGAAWRTLLENHPHDSICGTSADPVHREMMTRFARCRVMGEEIVSAALDQVIGRDPDTAREAGRARWRPAVLVFNPTPRARTGVVEADAALFLADVGVGQQGPRGARRPVQAPAGLVLRDPRGLPLPVQELERRTGHDLVESPRYYPDCDLVEVRRVVVRVEGLPPLGVIALAVEAGGRGGAPRIEGGVAVTDSGMENERLRLRIESDGTVAAADKASGARCHGLAALEDGGDAGDAYTYGAPRRARVACEPEDVAVRVVHSGPLRGELEIVRRYAASGLEVATRVTLDAGSSLVGLELAGVNLRDDHRLRIAFPLGARTSRVVADGHFGPVERAVRPARRRAGEREAPAPTAPMQRHVSVAAGARALTVFADGLPEYEVRRDGTVLVTVLRAFGQLSRRDIRERPGHAGWPTPTPDAQCRGPFAARLGVLLHGAAALDTRDEIERAAEQFHAPPLAVMRRALLERPTPVGGPELHGDGLVFSAMKPAEQGDGVVLRCCNGRAEPVRGVWRVPWPVRSAQLCRLDETPLARLEVRDGTVPFEAGPRAVVSVLLR